MFMFRRINKKTKLLLICLAHKTQRILNDETNYRCTETPLDLLQEHKNRQQTKTTPSEPPNPDQINVFPRLTWAFMHKFWLKLY